MMLFMGVAVGALGAMLGVGGGILLIPLLTGLWGIPIKTAIGVSILCVIATSSAAGAVHAGRGLTHNRLAMVLEIATTLGALAGGVTAVLINPRLLTALFGLILIYVAFSMRKLPRRPSGIGYGSSGYKLCGSAHGECSGVWRSQTADGHGRKLSCRKCVRLAGNRRRNYQGAHNELGYECPSAGVYRH